MLFAYSPVGGGTRYAVVFAWPWRVLTANIEQQGATLAGILVFGLIVALFVGLALSAYLSRPLQALADGAIRIARGQPLLPDSAPRPAGTEEISTLLGAFRQMEQAIQKRDQDLREGASLLEQRVRDRTQELVAIQAALVDAERFAAMGKTSAAIAHELKNALNGLGMAVELIAQDPQNSARVARLRPQVLGEIARLRDVVDSLLSFSRSPRIARGPADLAGVVARAAEAVADLVADRAVALRVDVPPALPVWCDAHKIQGVLVNLIKNAVEAGHARQRHRRDPRRRGGRRGRRRRAGPVRRGARTPVRAVLHDQAERHGAGAAHVAPVRRGARRAHRGRSRAAGWGAVSGSAADRHGAPEEADADGPP